MGELRNIIDLNGRVALVTGAGRGIGRQVALHLAEHGARAVIVNDFYLERAESVAEEIRRLGDQSIAVQADVSEFESAGSMVEAGLSRFGRIDVLVNNVGNRGPLDVSATELMAAQFVCSTPGDWSPWIRANMDAVLNCTRHVLPSMIQNRWGSIITIIADAARLGDQNVEVYSFANAGAAGFMRSVARTNGRFGIRANSVSLAVTRSPSSAPFFENENLMRKTVRSYPVGRLGEAEDVANMVTFLASDASSWITGQTYSVNGGLTFGL